MYLILLLLSIRITQCLTTSKFKTNVKECKMYVFNEPYVVMKMSSVKENYCRHFVALSNSYIYIYIIFTKGKSRYSNLQNAKLQSQENIRFHSVEKGTYF